MYIGGVGCQTDDTSPFQPFFTCYFIISYRTNEATSYAPSDCINYGIHINHTTAHNKGQMILRQTRAFSLISMAAYKQLPICYTNAIHCHGETALQQSSSEAYTTIYIRWGMCGTDYCKHTLYCFRVRDHKYRMHFFDF